MTHEQREVDFNPASSIPMELMPTGPINSQMGLNHWLGMSPVALPTLRFLSSYSPVRFDVVFLDTLDQSAVPDPRFHLDCSPQRLLGQPREVSLLVCCFCGSLMLCFIYLGSVRIRTVVKFENFSR